MGFGESFHTRFGASGDPAEGDFFADALQFIEDFVEEKLVLATAFQDREWLGAWKIDLRRESLDEIDVEKGVEVKVRSWRGTFDRNIICNG